MSSPAAARSSSVMKGSAGSFSTRALLTQAHERAIARLALGINGEARAGQPRLHIVRAARGTGASSSFTLKAQPMIG